jgi:hypothetical protein
MAFRKDRPGDDKNISLREEMRKTKRRNVERERETEKELTRMDLFRKDVHRNSGTVAIVIAILVVVFIIRGAVVRYQRVQSGQGNLKISEETKEQDATLRKYEKEFSISKYHEYLLAIVEVETQHMESGDAMQSSEAAGLFSSTMTTDESMHQICSYFSQLIILAREDGVDMDTVLQAFNYGPDFISYVQSRGGKYSDELAVLYAREKSEGEKVSYDAEIAVKDNGGWRYSYGNMFFARLVNQYVKKPLEP